MKDISVILNPIAGGGRGKKLQEGLIKQLDRRFGTNYRCFITTGPADATNITKGEIMCGSELIISVGGDGTINEIVNGFFSNGKMINTSCELGIINCSTGGGLAHTLSIPSALPDQLEVIQHGSTAELDIGELEYTGPGRQLHRRLFISECSAGIGGAIVADVRYGHKLLGGTLAFGIVALKHAFLFKPKLMEIAAGDGNPAYHEELLGMVAGNGNYCAGGMRLTPRASPVDGKFDILLMRKMTLLRRIRGFIKIYSGSHIDNKNFILFRTAGARISSPDHIELEADGEFLGTTPFSIRLLPNKIRIRCKAMPE